MIERDKAWLNLYEGAADRADKLLALTLAGRAPLGRAFIRFLRAWYAECKATSLWYGHKGEYKSRASIADLADFCSERHKISPQLIRLDNAPIFGALPEEIALLAPTLMRMDLCDVESIYALPLGIGKLQQLQHLNISGTYRISEIGDVFENLQQLQTINFSRTRITKLPASLLGLANLALLDISYTDIPQALAESYKQAIEMRLPLARVRI